MRINMDEADLEEFDKFVERNWGKQNAIPVSAAVTVGNEEPAKRRGRPKKEV